MSKGLNDSRTDFPILDQEVNGEPLVYLDNAATTQKPVSVLQTIMHYYEHDNANVHRGVHTLAERATEQFEAARDKVAAFINAPSRKTIVYTRSTTESLNWIASSFGNAVVNEGDEIVISELEHHSNVVPWQQVAKNQHATLKYIGLTADGELDMDDARKQITDKTKIVAIAHASNVMGVVNPIKELAQLAHAHNAYMVADGAQSTPHLKVDVQDLDVDFYAFSGHKMLAPTGIGILYGKPEILDEMEPTQFGGEMINEVHEQAADWKESPWKFEAGTPNISGAIALGSAIDYLNNLGMDNISAYEQELVDYTLPKLTQIDGITVYGPHDPAKHTGVLSFNLEGLHPHDVATGLDMDGIAVRAGHHCAQPLMEYLSCEATCRASFYFYNTKEEADRLLDALNEVKEFFANGTSKAERTV
ncbi:cysteine desulfurase, SufS subfamily [Lentilactobacillus parafarraginis F0439]|uniref:Cysteine desulfurase n=1 Tax=Lentilactobacillus parafarraginis F0439 TaxID=797515 RepID=G9ZMD2_9LACO|nr:cysteine desulfurase [Lentilactobacillus parafarraginis]EHL99759.1 cysteine desulfurase, SufS subfamily [Lentilactobacillus parafarraginis F0439]